MADESAASPQSAAGKSGSVASSAPSPASTSTSTSLYPGSHSLRQPSRSATFAGSTASADRRRSSLLSEFSDFRSSTDDLLLPKVRDSKKAASQEPSLWHSSPLAFALLPALGGMIFKDGSAVITDVTLLGLAAVFLNWSVRLPWDWYHASQSTVSVDPRDSDVILEESEEDADENADDNASPPSKSGPTPSSSKNYAKVYDPRASATKELHFHELLAFSSCFLFPALGAYLLHTLRAQLSRPSEGLISNYNLTIFLLVAELRPFAHLIKMIQSRTLYLQRIVHDEPYETQATRSTVSDLSQRLEQIEARVGSDTIGPTNPTSSTGKTPLTSSSTSSSTTITTEVRRGLQPDLDALNRAVRRYEKRATMQTMQTESRLLDLEARLADALSLAAAAASATQSSHHRARWPSFTAIVINWLCAAVVLPLQAFWALLNLPITAVRSIVSLTVGTSRGAGAGAQKKERERRGASAVRYRNHGRLGGERILGSGLKKT